MADVCMKEKHVESNGEIVSTCCKDCMAARRRTPCTPCIDSGSQSGWQDSYVRHAEQAAGEAAESGRDYNMRTVFPAPGTDFEGTEAE